MSTVIRGRTVQNGVLELSYLQHLTDEDLREVAGLTSLKRLGLAGVDKTQITNAGMQHLSGLVELQHLDLSNAQITDEGFVHLAGLTRLEQLWMPGTLITDDAVEQFAAYTALQRLSVQHTRISWEGYQKLWQILPSIKEIIL